MSGEAQSSGVRSAEEVVAWLNAEDPFHKWAVGSDVLCDVCGVVFKAEGVFIAPGDYATCPGCRDSHPHNWSAWRGIGGARLAARVDTLSLTE